MARFDYTDVMNELAELCSDIQGDIKQQLNYYRASVYKNETRTVIDNKLSQLKFIVDLMGDDEAVDLFADFEASASMGNVMIAPGECLLTTRVTQLFSKLNVRLQEVLSFDSRTDHGQKVCLNIQRNRKRIAAACKQGSRKKYFFETL